MKKIWLIIVAILVVGLVAGASFWAGMAYDQTKRTDQANQAQERFFQMRGTPPPAGQVIIGGDGLEGSRVTGNFRGAGTFGRIKSVNGNVLEISTAENVTIVNLSDTTQIEKTASGTLADLQPGTQIMVTGQSDDEGAITAERIQIMNLPAGFDNPAATPMP